MESNINLNQNPQINQTCYNILQQNRITLSIIISFCLVVVLLPIFIIPNINKVKTIIQSETETNELNKFQSTKLYDQPFLDGSKLHIQDISYNGSDFNYNFTLQSFVTNLRIQKTSRLLQNNDGSKIIQSNYSELSLKHNQTNQDILEHFCVYYMNQTMGFTIKWCDRRGYSFFINIMKLLKFEVEKGQISKQQFDMLRKSPEFIKNFQQQIMDEAKGIAQFGRKVNMLTLDSYIYNKTTNKFMLVLDQQKNELQLQNKRLLKQQSNTRQLEQSAEQDKKIFKDMMSYISSHMDKIRKITNKLKIQSKKPVSKQEITIALLVAEGCIPDFNPNKDKFSSVLRYKCEKQINDERYNYRIRQIPQYLGTYQIKALQS